MTTRNSRSLENSLANFFSNIFGKKEQEKGAVFELLNELRFLENRYSIRPSMYDVLKKEQRTIEGKQMDFHQALKAVRVFREELAKYPPEFIRALGITKFRIINDLSIKDTDRDVFKKVGGVAFERGEIYIVGDSSTEYMKQTIHHELLHRMDYEQYESKDRLSFIGFILDELRDIAYNIRWQTLNDHTDFLYDPYYDYKKHTKRPPGFARSYGKISPGEDRATIAELLFVKPVYLFKLCQQDKILAGKVKELILNYEKRSEGKINENYFVKLAKGQINEAYWDYNLE